MVERSVRCCGQSFPVGTGVAQRECEHKLCHVLALTWSMHATLNLMFMSGGVTASTCVVATVCAPFGGRFCGLSRRAVMYRKVNMPHIRCGFMKRMTALFQGTREWLSG